MKSNQPLVLPVLSADANLKLYEEHLAVLLTTNIHWILMIWDWLRKDHSRHRQICSKKQRVLRRIFQLCRGFLKLVAASIVALMFSGPGHSLLDEMLFPGGKVRKGILINHRKEFTQRLPLCASQPALTLWPIRSCEPLHGRHGLLLCWEDNWETAEEDLEILNWHWISGQGFPCWVDLVLEVPLFLCSKGENMEKFKVGDLWKTTSLPLCLLKTLIQRRTWSPSTRQLSHWTTLSLGAVFNWTRILCAEHSCLSVVAAALGLCNGTSQKQFLSGGPKRSCLF